MKTAKILIAILAGIAFSGSALAQTALPKAVDGVLVSESGMTLYTFDKDMAGSGKSNCNGPCLALWPAVPAPATMPAGKYSVVTRDDGSKQLAYDGKPLYFYAADKHAGERTGDNFKGVWHVVKE
jgi:predicted lipoprotein with Yx(FWY)xxD motif